ncbi:MAG: hypothetical protein CV089_17055 [Nitrospira sp. WS110]|nr:hypothetical protein [Nitrospira sp. WS110]
MTTRKSQLVQHTLAAISLIVVLGALSMIWPVIIAVFLGILLLLQSFSSNEELVVLAWIEVGHVPIALSSLRRLGLSTDLS